MKAKRSGEKSAVTQLARQRSRFLAFLQARLGSREEAEELLQAAYAKGLKAASALKEDEKVTAWFYRLLRNALIDHWRKRAAEGRAVTAYGLESARRAKMDDERLNRRVCACVKELVDTIKPEYAQAIRQVDLAETSVRDFARNAGVSPNSASVRLHRARTSLKKRLIETCGKCAEHDCRDCDCGKV